LIVHINTSSEWRGGEQQLFYLALGLENAKKPQRIICQPNSPLEERCLEAGIRTFPIPMRGEWDWRAAKWIKNLLLFWEASLVHAHTAHAHTLALWSASCPILVSRRVDFPPRMGIFSRWKYNSRKVSYYLTVSNCIRRILSDAGIPEQKLITVYSGIDTKKFSKLPRGEDLRRDLGLDKKEIIITNVAALVDHKDQETLIRSISKVNSKIPFKLLIAGIGPLEKKLKRLTEDLGVSEKVVFLGFQEDIPALFGITDIFTMTSKEEGLGTSILDAMASGLPVIATKGGGISEMLDEGKGARLASVKDTESLAKYFQELIESESLRQSFGSYNKVAVKRFSYQETVGKTMLIYYSLLGNKF